MPDISLSEQQLAALEAVQAELAAEHVGRYGHVRLRDVVQFLIDRYEAADRIERKTIRRVIEHQLADRSYQDLQSLAADTDGVDPTGKADDLRARLIEARTDALLTDLTTPPEEEIDAGAATMEHASEIQEGVPAAATESPAESGEPTGSTSDTDTNDAPDEGSSRLERMMGLLDRHADRWERTDSDEGRYAVTLPDGSVKTVRTKDDVRATLFKHYD